MPAQARGKQGLRTLHAQGPFEKEDETIAANDGSSICLKEWIMQWQCSRAEYRYRIVRKRKQVDFRNEDHDRCRFNLQLGGWPRFLTV
jgi:hypothetical protein